MEKLTLINRKRQKNKQSKHETQDVSIIKYPHLMKLDIAATLKDCREQFLADTKMCLPNGIHVYMNYPLVREVTRNFRRNITRSNCEKINDIYFCNKFTFPEHFKGCFPHAKIF
jgi:hypothetical protein